LLHVSHTTGAPYALLYGTATYYTHLSLTPRVRTIGVCCCAPCLLAGSGRIAAAVSDALAIDLGGAPGPAGDALVRLPVHIPGAAAPLVAIDGKVQPGVTVRNAAAWARGLNGAMTGTKAAARPKGRP
jgi:NADH:ubiquinone oxidoreductase subunit E